MNIRIFQSDARLCYTIMNASNMSVVPEFTHSLLPDFSSLPESDLKKVNSIYEEGNSAKL